MNDIEVYQHPDDIFREIDLEDQDAIDEENARLIKMRKGYRSNFTLSVNSINNLITASRGDNGALDKSQANKEALLRAREKLEIRYEKLQYLNNRQLVITQDEETDEREAGHYQKWIDHAAERYNQVIRDLAKLEEAIHPQTNWNDVRNALRQKTFKSDLNFNSHTYFMTYLDCMNHLTEKKLGLKTSVTINPN